MATYAHLWVQVEYPPIASPPVAGRIIQEEGAHDFVELSWTRSTTGYLPGYDDDIRPKMPIAIRYGRRTLPPMVGDEWFYGYVETIEPGDRGITISALGTTERLRAIHPRHVLEQHLSTLLAEIAQTYRMQSRIDGEDTFIQGVYQDDSDWALLNKLADDYGYALLSANGWLVMRKRDVKVFGDPPLMVSRASLTTGLNVRAGRWLLQPVRQTNVDSLTEYAVANVDPRTGVAFRSVMKPTEHRVERRRLMVGTAANGYDDALAALRGKVQTVEQTSDRATGVAVEGTPGVWAGNTLLSINDKRDIDGLWWVCRIEHRFNRDESTSMMDLTRPFTWSYDPSVLSDLVRQPRLSNKMFPKRPRRINDDWWFT